MQIRIKICCIVYISLYAKETILTILSFKTMAEHKGKRFCKADVDLEFVLFVFRMPKEGLEASAWEKRLKLFAQGKFEFGRGRAPPPTSVWAKKIDSIKKCGVGKAKMDIFGRAIVCSCGYHQETVDVPRVFT